MSDFGLIGVTARLAAYYRQFGDLPFAREAARLVRADEAFAELVDAHGLDPEQLRFYAPMFEARYRSVGALIRASGGRQVLELAAGYTLRGLALAQDAGLRYVETDLPEVTATRRALLDELRRAHGLDPSLGPVVAVADALDLGQLRAAAAPLSHSEPLTVVCEGLLLYLTRAEIRRVAENVRTLLAEFAGGAWITPDFVFRSETRDLPPGRRRLREVVAGVTERQLDAGAFDDEQDLAAFLQEVGFEATVHRQIDLAPELSSVRALGLSPTVVEALRPRLRVWTLTPR